MSLLTWLLPVCVALGGAALLVAPGLARDARLPGFEACDLPCWGGLLPGETPFREAAAVLRQHLAPDATVASDGVMVVFHTRSAEPYISGVVSYNNAGSVGTIYLNTVVPFVYLLDRLATPDCLWVSQTSDHRALFFVIWKRDGWFIKAFVPADEYGRLNGHLTAHDVEIGASRSICDGNGASPWLGFAPAWRYVTVREANLKAVVAAPVTLNLEPPSEGSYAGFPDGP